MADVGRPTVFDEMTLQKLEAAFANDATDLQACFLAKISKSSLYNYQKEHPEFLERKKALKAMTAYKAKLNIKTKIEEGDIDTSKWYAERKEKKEFSTRQEHGGIDGKELPTPILATAYVQTDNSNKESNEPEEENTSDSRGDISKQDDQHTPVLDSLSTDG